MTGKISQAEQMLARLGSGVGPRGPPAGSPAVAAMLDAARRGDLRTGLPVRIDDTLGLTLSPEQASRLSEAVDRAAASGADTALVLLDGRGLRVDTTERRVLGVEPLTDGSMIDGIGAVVVSAETSATPEAGRAFAGLSTRPVSAGVLRAISGGTD
jgi:hypothetical protein